MKCKHVLLHICENLDADLHSAKCREVRKHITQCPDCAAYLDSVKKTVSLYASAPIPGVPLGAHGRLLKAINLSRDSRTKSRPAL